MLMFILQAEKNDGTDSGDSSESRPPSPAISDLTKAAGQDMFEEPEKLVRIVTRDCSHRNWCTRIDVGW